MTKTLRMSESGSTLDGYIFDDYAHARAWLSQPIIAPHLSKITLRPVEVGEFRKCRQCGGAGHTRSVKNVGDQITADDFLRRKE